MMRSQASKSSAVILAALLGVVGCGDTSKSTATATADKSASPDKSAKPATSGSAKASASAAPSASAAAPGAGFTPTVAPIEIGKPEPQKIGDKTVVAEVCKIDGALMKAESFSKSIGEITLGTDGAVYVLDHEGELRKYQPIEGPTCQLALDQSFGDKGILLTSKGERATALAVDDSGTIYVSSYGMHPVKVSGGKIAGDACDENGVLRVAPSGKTGVLGRKKVTIEGGKCTGTDDYKPTGVDAKFSLSEVWTFGDDILVEGSDNSMTKVGIYGADDKQKAFVGEKDGNNEICSFGGAQKCNMGICIQDSNCRGLRVWTADGKIVGGGKLGEMAGLSYPWPVGFVVGKNVAYMSWTHSAKDSTADKNSYGVIIRVMGLN